MPDPLGLIGQSGGVQPQPTPRADGAQGQGNFKDVLMDSIEQVNKLQQEADSAIEDLAAGRRTDVASVMIAKQKADTAFQMLLQVRNKMLDAYNDIKDIRV